MWELHPKTLDALKPRSFSPGWEFTGELALEVPVGAGSAVDAQVPSFRVVHQLLPHALRAGSVEKTLHRDGEGAARHQTQGTPRGQFSPFPGSALHWFVTLSFI